jgi:tetratricopeptide (TPR) repeat protein
MAEVLHGLQRFEGTITGAQQAIQLSDGKFARIHFRLGSAYFTLQNWDFAQQNFDKAPELDSKMPAAVYCGDAPKWYKEFLRRNPSASDRSNVEASTNALLSKTSAF